MFIPLQRKEWGKELPGHCRGHFCCAYSLKQEEQYYFSYKKGNWINHISNWTSISRLFYPIVLWIEDTSYKGHIVVSSDMEADFCFHTVERGSNSDTNPNLDQAASKPSFSSTWTNLLLYLNKQRFLYFQYTYRGYILHIDHTCIYQLSNGAEFISCIVSVFCCQVADKMLLQVDNSHTRQWNMFLRILYL